MQNIFIKYLNKVFKITSPTHWTDTMKLVSNIKQTVFANTDHQYDENVVTI